MALRLKGRAPQPGQLDRRCYMIDVQVGNRRARLSSGVRDRALAQAREQLTLDTLRADRDTPHTALVELIRGKVSSTRRQPPALPIVATDHQAGLPIRRSKIVSPGDAAGAGGLIHRAEPLTRGNLRTFSASSGQASP